MTKQELLFKRWEEYRHHPMPERFEGLSTCAVYEEDQDNRVTNTILVRVLRDQERVRAVAWTAFNMPVWLSSWEWQTELGEYRTAHGIRLSDDRMLQYLSLCMLRDGEGRCLWPGEDPKYDKSFISLTLVLNGLAEDEEE